MPRSSSGNSAYGRETSTIYSAVLPVVSTVNVAVVFGGKAHIEVLGGFLLRHATLYSREFAYLRDRAGLAMDVHVSTLFQIVSYSAPDGHGAVHQIYRDYDHMGLNT